MKRSYVGIIGLCIILAFNIVLTQLLVHQFYYENYQAVFIYTIGNFVLFPVAILIYKKEKHKGGESHAKK
ncbi:hypothetical protein [Aquibacillus albus]|uniref:Na+-driven multidrug efflux pump n=1 Tax=Aquibacillus albus TaxID=1168171 RepID=A0ABS2MYP2_9BACI|nr:hypothetical protein [Aquibacillus albus]MBM7570961.1 Na+-driven multidrug efflux pump [Aquibacillus albus]